MLTSIMDHLEQPEILEAMYQQNKSAFEKEFEIQYPLHKENKVFQFWHARIHYKSNSLQLGSKQEIVFIIICSLLAGLVANIPNYTGINEETFFSRNIAFIVFPFLSAYYLWKQEKSLFKILLVTLLIIVSATYINLIPHQKTDSIFLILIHIPLLLWAILGYAFLGNQTYDTQKRIQFLRFNGDLIVTIGIMFLAGVVFTMITFGLFELINLKIETFYIKNIASWGLAAIPIIANYLIHNNPSLINKISPTIAKIFTPLVTLLLLVYLVAVLYTGKSPYSDRNLLIVFNALLILVMALILFSVAEMEKNKLTNFKLFLLLTLSFITILINSIALYAIIHRLLNLGMTPNRLAVLGSNLFIFFNLVIVGVKFFQIIRNNENLDAVETTIAKYLPVYIVWIVFVSFLLPLLFQFK